VSVELFFTYNKKARFILTESSLHINFSLCISFVIDLSFVYSQLGDMGAFIKIMAKA
jgi:hypothetical protein